MLNNRIIILLICGLLILAAFNAFFFLSAKTMHSHECFVSVTAREMLEKGTWIVPTMDEQPRINKTPLPYWLVAAVAELSGRVDEFTSRFPSAVFAILSVVAVLYFLNEWLGMRIAAVCSAVWATSYAYFSSSHNARPDMALTFFVTLCFFSFYSAVNSESSGKRIIYALIFWISFGLGNLAKGPAPVPFVFLPLFFYIFLTRKWSATRQLLYLPGIIVFLIIILPWPLFIAHKMNWDLILWREEFIDRLFGEYAPGYLPFYSYFGIMFKYIAPWVIFLPIALLAPLYKVWGSKRPVMRYLWFIFIINIIFLSLDAGRRQHYILPIMPVAAILVGIVLEDMVFTRKAFSLLFAKRIFLVHFISAVTGAIAALIYISIFLPRFLQGTLVLSSVVLLSSALVLILFVKNKPIVALAFCFITITVVASVCYIYFLPAVDRNSEVRIFAQKTASLVPPEDKLVSYKEISMTFVQYYGKSVPVVNDKTRLDRLYQDGDWIVALSDNLQDLKNDTNFKMVYYKERKKGLNEDTGGAVFHK